MFRHGGVVEANRHLAHPGVAGARDEAQAAEDELDDIPGARPW